MKVTLENTTKVVNLRVNGVDVPARIWEGITEKGIRCHTYITLIAAGPGQDQAEFQAELKEQKTPTAAIEAIPLRMIL